MTYFNDPELQISHNKIVLWNAPHTELTNAFIANIAHGLPLYRYLLNKQILRGETRRLPTFHDPQENRT